MMALTASNADASSSTSTAHRNPIAELKNGKVIFKQKPISFEKASETMQEIVKFREMLDSRVQSQEDPLSNIPEEHKPIVVKLAQESDKGVVPLAKQIRSILLPGPGEVEDTHRLSLESALPLIAVEQAIKMVMTRANYGLDGALGQKLPAAVCVWRWEVRESYKDWLPKSAKENAEARMVERVQASKDLRAAFENLSQAERDAILDPKGANKLPVKDTNKSETTIVPAVTTEDSSGNQIQKDTQVTSIEGQTLSENVAPKGRAKKIPDPEKVAKVKEKEEKRVAKAEKEKKEKESQDKSRSIMASFFGKSKPTAQDSSTRQPNATASPSIENDFQRTFKPFVLKKDAELAPYNWFSESRGNNMTGITHDQAIVVDDDVPPQVGSELKKPSGENRQDSPSRSLQEFIQVLRRRCLSCPKQRRLSQPKTYNPQAIRDTISQLNDAEIAGDPAQVRHLLAILGDRQVFPAKVFVFHEDARPGYYGTWTRNSRVVGPRTPLGRDVLARDYGYDSGEEWEDEGAGDADDVVEDGEDEEPDAEDPDSDLDSWLVEDDEEAGPPLEPDGLSPPPFDLPMPPPKRKADASERQAEKKRKVVVPLIPYAKGPFWESSIGQCDYDPFNAYRAQLLNDTPYPIDPFAFVSTVPSEQQIARVASSSFVAPYLPDPVQSTAGTAPAAALKRAAASTIPKTVFPDAHLSALLEKINALATPSFNFLVESIYQELRVHKIKKNAIEAKVREMGEKSKEKKIWVVKQAPHELA